MVGLKSLVAVLVVLVIAAVALSPGGPERMGGFMKDVENWFGLNIGGIVSKPLGETKAVSLSLSPATPFSIAPNGAVNITAGSVHINGFSGYIIVGNDSVALSETGTGLNLTLPANGTAIAGLRLDELSFSNTAFYISPNITATDGNITITGFRGLGSIDAGTLSLEGNASVRAVTGGVNVMV